MQGEHLMTGKFTEMTLEFDEIDYRWGSGISAKNLRENLNVKKGRGKQKSNEI